MDYGLFLKNENCSTESKINKVLRKNVCDLRSIYFPNERGTFHAAWHCEIFLKEHIDLKSFHSYPNVVLPQKKNDRLRQLV